MNLGATTPEECMQLDICSFYGTTYTEKGLPKVCGEKSVGVGKFELPGSNVKPQFESVCQRHKGMYIKEYTQIL